MNDVERCDELRFELERVSLNERERIMRLRINIHSDNIESRPAVAKACAASTTEKIEQFRFGFLYRHATLPAAKKLFRKII